MTNTAQPFDERSGYIWIDGSFCDWKDAKIHVMSHGLHYGSSVFEGIRTYNRKPFKLREHMERFHFSAQSVGLDIPFSVDQLMNATEELIKKQDVCDAYVRPLAWLGSERVTISSIGCKTHVMIACWTWPNYFRDFENGIRLQWADWRRPSPDSAPGKAKAGGLYIISTLSKNKAEHEGFQDAIMLDHNGNVAECASANIFIVKNGCIQTPVPHNFLNGITRLTVIDIAHNLGIPCIEKDISPDELLEADEIFVTGSASEVLPVGEVAGKHFKERKMTTKIRLAYGKLVQGENL